MGQQEDEEQAEHINLRILDVKVNNILSHVRQIRQELPNGRQAEIVDRLQDVESELSELSKDVQASTWAGVGSSIITDPRTAVIFLLVFGVVVLGLWLLGVDPTTLFGNIGFLAAHSGTMVPFTQRVEKKYHRYCDKYSDAKAKWLGDR